MVIVNFNKGLYLSIANGLVQWDYGQVLRIQGLSLPSSVEIHFSLQETGGESITRLGITKDGVTDVLIPDFVFEQQQIEDYTAYAFIYLSSVEEGQTVHKIVLNIKARPKPEAFETPEDKTLFQEAIDTFNDLYGKTLTSETNAKASETNASNSEINAKISETNANQSALVAKQQADRAKEIADGIEQGTTGGVTKKYVDEQDIKTLQDAKTYTDGKVPTAEEKLTWNNKANTSDIPTKLSELSNDTNFAKTSDIPTKTSQLVNDSHFLTSHQDLSLYAKKTELPKKTSQLTNDSNFLTEHQSLIEYAKKTELPKKTSQLLNDSGFLTQHQSLKDYAKTSDVNKALETKVTNAKGVANLWKGTQEEYDLLPVKDVETTVYIILEGEQK